MSLLPCLFDVRRPFRSVENDFFRSNDVFPICNQIVPRDYFNPNQFVKQFEKMCAPWEQLANVMNQLALTEGTKISSDYEKFQVNIDVQHFSPEEIDVKVIEGYVVVEGKHEEKRDEHGYISRQFVRRYALPQGCLPDTVESKLSSDGVLTITAPKVLALPSTGERIVPITHTGPVKKQIGSPEQIREQ